MVTVTGAIFGSHNSGIMVTVAGAIFGSHNSGIMPNGNSGKLFWCTNMAANKALKPISIKIIRFYPEMT